MANLQQIEENPVYKQVVKDAFGGVLYNVANRDKYDGKELLGIWDNLTDVQRSSANGITEGAINFLKGN
jgi:hypothetical protein